MASLRPPVADVARGPRVLSLVVLVACAIAPGVVALIDGAPLWALAGVLPLMVSLMVLARDHDSRIDQAARRLIAVERERDRLAESVRHVGRAFGSGLDLPALTEVLAGTAADALDSRRSLVRIGEHVGRGGPAARELDALLDDITAGAVASHGLVFGHSASGHHAMAHPLREGAGVLAVARSARDFTEDEQALLSWLAAQATVGVENVALHERLRAQAQVDELTGLGNNRVFRESLERELALSARSGIGVGLVLMDLDDFKDVNDTHGHPTGDRVLAAVGAALRNAVRSTDTVVRWGGEEFAVILPHTDLPGATVAAEAVRRAVCRVRVALPNGAALRITASLGVAAAPGNGRGADRLYAVADRALYAAKQAGKDRVAVSPAGVQAHIVA